MRKLYLWLTLVLLFALIADNAHALARPVSRYFPVTGYSVSQPFLDYWNSHGTTAQLGQPISTVFAERSTEDGKTYQVQYFERARLEYHPEQRDAKYRIMLGLIGVELFKAKYPDGSLPPDPTNPDGSPPFNYPEFDNPFGAYAFSHGGAEMVGEPIARFFYETETDGRLYRVLYLERVRLENHGKILPGLVGSELYRVRYGKIANPSHHPVQASTCYVNPTFQAVLNYNRGLAQRLGCSIDDGQDYSDGVRAGYQHFKHAEMLLITPLHCPGYVYELTSTGYKRFDYEGPAETSQPSPAPGLHFASIIQTGAAYDNVGDAMDNEDFTAGAVQHFQNGVLY